jgi:hypothetical protein
MTADQLSLRAGGTVIKNLGTKFAAVVSAALVLSSALVGGASASAHSRQANMGMTRLSFDYAQAPPIIGAPVCDQSSCVIPFSILGTASGDLTGTSVQAGSAVQFADGTLYANSTFVFRGTVMPCGSGTVTMRSTGFNRAGVTSGEIVIVEGSGTGDLAGLEGQGTVVNGQADPSGSGVATGTIELRVRCGAHS